MERTTEKQSSTFDMTNFFWSKLDSIYSFIFNRFVLFKSILHVDSHPFQRASSYPSNPYLPLFSASPLPELVNTSNNCLDVKLNSNPLFPNWIVMPRSWRKPSLEVVELPLISIQTPTMVVVVTTTTSHHQQVRVKNPKD